MTVKQFVMLLTSQSIISTYNVISNKSNSYKYACPIHHIICMDGKKLSVQAHGSAYAKFKDIPCNVGYSKTFGKDLLACETNCEDLNEYGSNTIEEIEAYVESHGGIDIEATVAAGVETAIYILERTNKEDFNSLSL